jgi:hypothetical protein
MTGEVPIVRLKIVLGDVTPKVERWLVVPQKIRLDRLNEVIQAAMGWTNSHLWEFRTKDCEWGIKSHDDALFGGGPLDARKASLRTIIQETGAKTIHYIYDFGDYWDHTIKLDKFMSVDPLISGPSLVEARGACPPEDCGGPWRYMELLEAIKNPAHEDHEEAVEILPENFNPATAPMQRLYDHVEALAAKWAPKPRMPKTQR